MGSSYAISTGSDGAVLTAKGTVTKAAHESTNQSLDLYITISSSSTTTLKPTGHFALSSSSALPIENIEIDVLSKLGAIIYIDLTSIYDIYKLEFIIINYTGTKPAVQFNCRTTTMANTIQAKLLGSSVVSKTVYWS